MYHSLCQKYVDGTFIYISAITNLNRQYPSPLEKVCLTGCYVPPASPLVSIFNDVAIAVTPVNANLTSPRLALPSLWDNGIDSNNDNDRTVEQREYRCTGHL